MKRMFLIAMVLAITYLFIGAACSMGPIMVSPHVAQWDKAADLQVSGYYIYWRTVGTTGWSNTNRSAVIAQPIEAVVPTYELLTLVLANGNYEICATARDITGNESGPSNIVTYIVYIPNNPLNLIKK